ncbi:hypothetical protein [Paenibacillus sp. HW567]|uniref:hypothetical protein n=1 Tax=Paenibacillus sp. HW567 TaxID=1034769 RepID=UPI000379880A|nr:hypothetical protein [Paenibacillus sp. HW567]
MKIKARQKDVFGRRVRLVLCLCLGLVGFSAVSAFPPALAATGSKVTVTQAVSKDHLPLLTLKSVPSPESLQDFTRRTIRKLSADAPFTAWADAGTEYFPLGPGTHGWLVNVLNGDQRIGYLVISATEQGGYMLSEYGAGSYGLPYSLQDLRQFLVQQELIPSAYSGKLELTALYAPLLPLWKLTTDQTTLYINASVLQVMPWSPSQAEAVLTRTLDGASSLSSLDTGRSPLRAYRSGGQDDPYADLLWLTAPSLKSVSGDSLAALLAASGSLAFQAAGRNDTLGAPFMVTGYQSWRLTSSGSKDDSSRPAIVYALSGPEGRRYLPLAVLLEKGTFHKLPSSGNPVPSTTVAKTAHSNGK